MPRVQAGEELNVQVASLFYRIPELLLVLACPEGTGVDTWYR